MKNRARKSKIMPNPISMVDWMEMHPFPAHYPSDNYYRTLSNRLLTIISPITESGFYTMADARRLALAVTAYFEDVISKLGMWRTFIEEHKRRYGKWLPWYETDTDYYEDEINLQDVQFVLWINMMTMRGGNIVNPSNPVLSEMAEAIYAVLEDEFEKAPINDELVEDFYSPETTDNFMKLKALLMWMASTSYLLRPNPSNIKDIEIIAQALNESLNMKDRPGLSEYVLHSYYGVAKPIGPLSLRAPEWYALMREQNGIPHFNNEIREIKSAPFYAYWIKSINNDGTITLRSCRDKDYNVAKNSFEEGSERLLQPGALILALPAYYRDRWHINGFASFYNMNEISDTEAEAHRIAQNLYNENGQPCDLMMVMDTENEPVKNELDVKKSEKIIKKNGGRQLYYFPNLKSALEWSKKTLGFSVKNDLIDDYDDKRPILVYLAKDGQICISNTANNINDPNNPYFDPDDNGDGLSIICDCHSIPKEVLSYLLDHKLLDNVSLKSFFGEGHGRKLLQENIRFLATYMRGEQI